MTLVVIWNWKFSSSMHSYGSYRSTWDFTMLFSFFLVFLFSPAFFSHVFPHVFISSHLILQLFSQFHLWKMNPMGFHTTSCDVSMLTEKEIIYISIMRRKTGNVSQVGNFGMFFQWKNSFSFKSTPLHIVHIVHIGQIPFIKWHPFSQYVQINMNDTFFFLKKKCNTKI